VTVKAETMGRVTRFDKQEGEAVSAGEAVVWVNDENYQLALRQAQTALKVAEASLDRATLLEQHGVSELERARNLVKSGGITDKDLKSAEITRQEAKAQVVMAEAQCEASRSAIEVAQKHLRDAVIHSPVSGVIQRKFVNKGAYVEAPTELFSIVDNAMLEMESPVATAELGGIAAGQRVTFAVNSYPGVKFEGRVVESAPEVDVETRSAKVRIQIPGSGGKLKAGMFAEGEILTGTSPHAVVIPAAAAYRDDRSAKSSYVFVVENGKAVRRAVRIGRERDGKLEIVEGLKPGDSLISEQSIEIAEGVRVQARN
jgi:RND family efflux transporter MFP subunit